MKKLIINKKGNNTILSQLEATKFDTTQDVRPTAKLWTKV